MSKEKNRNQEAIAIIGMACMFPQAPDIKTFWRNILEKVNTISEPLPEWEADRFLKSNRIDTSRGSYLKDLYRFDPREFGIMPKSVDGGEPDQFLALRLASDALQDAGYLNGDYDHQDTGLVIGHSTYLHRGQGNLLQHHLVLDQSVELLKAVLPSLDEVKLTNIRNLLESKLPQFNVDVVPGLVPNVMTGRIANRLNLNGPNYLVDGACASSLLAVNAAIDELRNGRSRIMLAGGVNASIPAEVSVIFTQLGALSKSGEIHPFGADCDGTLLGEGAGIIVLKRASDAIADGDRIYALIRGIGIASDGKAHGLLAPSTDGEALAIERAYSDSGVDPASIELIESHGTGIPLGDKTEISALKKIFGERKGAQGYIAIGSVKSMIGHCIPAAGIAGLIKSALSLHHKILPPTICATINPELDIENTPFYVNTENRPWITRPGVPRRTGINAFGFGGINAHAILEEAPPQGPKPPKFMSWPFEICIFSAGSVDELKEKLNQILNLLRNNTDGLVGDIAFALVSQDTKKPYRLGMVVKDAEDLAKKIKQALKRLKNDSDNRWSTRNGIVYSMSPLNGKLAFMFPGEGSQYLGMFEDLALYFDEVRDWFDFFKELYNDVPGETRTDILFPPQSEMTQQRRKALEMRLHDMDVGSEAVFVGGQAMHALLRSLGVQPDVMVGHSTGESSALAASGAMNYNDFGGLANFIRELNKVYQCVLGEGKIPTGALLTVGALSQSNVEEHIAAIDKDIVIAMDNCINQLILFGDKDSIDALQKSLSTAGGVCIPLPFDRGYHTPRFSAVSEAFLDYYEKIGLKTPHIPLYSCASADLFPEDQHEIRKLAAVQWSTKVRFRETVSKMHRDGVRYFVEVGPSGNLCAFVKDILSGKEFLSLPTDHRRKSGVEQFLNVLAHLYVNGKEVQLEKLFSSRSVSPLDLAKSIQTKQPGMYLDNTMPVLHINDDDRNVLREMLMLPEGMRHEDQENCGMQVPKTQFEQVDSFDELKTDHHVMADYFNLMGSFLNQQGRTLENWERCEETVQEEVVPIDDYAPFLTSITELDEQHLEGWCCLSVYEDNFLRDHVLSGVVSEDDPELVGLSCVPLMVSLEIMAEACALLAGSTGVRMIENVKAFDWIALDDGELTLNIRAELIDMESKTYRAHIFNAGNIAVTADFVFEADWCASAIPILTEKRKFRWDGHELYSIGMFHGPVFQSIRQIDGWNDEGIEASLTEVQLDGFFNKNETPELVLNPVLLDALGQLSAYWIAQQVGTDFNCFPSTIERIELYEDCPQNLAGLKLRACQKPLDPTAKNMDVPRVWQFECLDNAGRPLLRATNLVNIYFPVPNRFYEFRRDPLNGWLGHLSKITENENAILWQLEHLSEEFCTQSSGIFLRILAHALLSFDERNEWRELKTNIRKKREWLLGRACIKEAVRFWIYQQTGKLLYAADIVVLHDEMGAPYVDGWWSNNLIQPPEVSLSHDRQLSLAAVTPPQQPVGVDVEQIGRIKHPELVEDSLNERERKLLQRFEGDHLQEKILRMWCAKEAAAKFLGLGLQGRPEKFEVSFIDDDWERAHVTYEEAVSKVVVSCENDAIVAIATGGPT